ncbi:MAG: hypothetical protein JRG80_19095, partial [Deltaproteobacteria bacterium]|nr:hypothetical protein [Deltaproteobacteria bacterium]
MPILQATRQTGPKRPDFFALVEAECSKLGIPAIDATPSLRARLDAGVLVV